MFVLCIKILGIVNKFKLQVFSLHKNLGIVNKLLTVLFSIPIKGTIPHSHTTNPHPINTTCWTCFQDGGHLQ